MITVKVEIRQKHPECAEVNRILDGDDLPGPDVEIVVHVLNIKGIA